MTRTRYSMTLNDKLSIIKYLASQNSSGGALKVDNLIFQHKHMKKYPK